MRAALSNAELLALCATVGAHADFAITVAAVRPLRPEETVTAAQCAITWKPVST